MTDGAAQRITSEAELETVLAEPLAVVYKHSPRCGICTGAMIEVQRFAEGRPEVPVYVVDVIAHRSISRSLAERLGVRHQSPQVIVLEAGRVVWHASHFRVSAERLDSALAAARAAHEG